MDITKVSMTSGNEFENIIANIIRGGAGQLTAYQTLPLGCLGDGGIDVVEIDKNGFCYACYGAESRDSYQKGVVKKFKNDCDNFFKNKAKWNNAKKFVFVTNQIDTRQPDKFIEEIGNMIKKYNFDIEVWSLKDFFDYFKIGASKIKERLQNDIFEKFNNSYLNHMLTEQSWHGAFSVEDYNYVLNLFYYLKTNKIFDEDIANLYEQLNTILEIFNNHSQLENGYYKSYPRSDRNDIFEETHRAINEIQKRLGSFHKSLSEFIKA